MLLDKSLYPYQMLKFERQRKGETQVKLVYNVKINYAEGHTISEGDVYESPEVQKDLNTTVGELKSIMRNHNNSIKAKMHMEVGEHYTVPLWVFNGNHHYSLE